MADAAAAISNLRSMQSTLLAFNTLTLCEYLYPSNCSLTNGSYFDFIIVGSGTAGSILANRLSANSSIKVLLLEAGGYPPFESQTPSLFPLLTGSQYDYDFQAVNDNYTMQNKQNHTCSLTQGKMLGGTSSMYHMMHTRGDCHDYDYYWADALNDTAWNSTNTLKYFKKYEKLIDEEILKSSYVSLYGTDGMVPLKREKSEVVAKYFDAFKQLGHNIALDSTSNHSFLGYSQTLFAIAENMRQSSALAYLNVAKNRSNLCVALLTTATKVLIENGVAVGVQVTTSSNETFILYANKEVIVSAGAINSPKLLMLSGIGPQAHLESLGIKVVANLPVGQNYMDQPGVPLIYQMEKSCEKSAASNPYNFPAPAFFGTISLNSSQSWPSYQTINLVFHPNSTDLLNLCVFMFRYSEEICQNMYEGNKNRWTFFALTALALPDSRGQVSLASADPTVPPIIETGIFTNGSDLTLMGQAVMDHIRILNTTYFRSVNATLMASDLCNNTNNATEYWECYCVKMSTGMWHFGGTCAMGLVLDSSMRVKGISSLRVVDSSAMPALISGKINAPVAMMAERASDLIYSAWNITVS